jgi:hypothetical protein
MSSFTLAVAVQYEDDEEEARATAMAISMLPEDVELEDCEKIRTPAGAQGGYVGLKWTVER